MGRLKPIARLMAALTAAMLALVMALLVLGNLSFGQALLERLAARASGGTLVVSGLSGRFPGALRAERIALQDGQGTWLTLDALSLDWTPLALLGGTLDIGRLEVTEATLVRPPAATESGAAPLPLPFRVVVDRLRLKRLELAPAVVGGGAAVAIDGRAEWRGADRANIDFSATRLDAAGNFHLQATIDPGAIHAALSLEEPPHGLAAFTAGLPDLGALELTVHVAGPRSDLRTDIALTAGALRGQIQGTVDLQRNSATLTLRASSPAMRPRTDVAWNGLNLAGEFSGPFAEPTVVGDLVLELPRIAGAGASDIRLELRGHAGDLNLSGRAEDLRIPGPQPDLFAGQALTWQGNLRLDRPARPVSFTLHHPLLQAQASGETQNGLRGELALTLPELSPFAALAGMDLHGNSRLRLQASGSAAAMQLALDGTLGLTGGTAPLLALVGDQANITGRLAVTANTLSLSELRLDGRSLDVLATGTLAKTTTDLHWEVALRDLAAFSPKLAGDFLSQGLLQGTPEHLDLRAGLRGRLGVGGMPVESVAAEVDLSNLPNAPSGRLTVNGTLDASPLRLDLALDTLTARERRVRIEQAQWKSAQAEGSVIFSDAGDAASGKIGLRVVRLADLAGLLGRPLSGSLSATVGAEGQQAQLQGRLMHLGLDTTLRVDQAALAVTVADPLGHPTLTGKLQWDGFHAGALTGSGTLGLAGPAGEPDLRLDALLLSQGTEHVRLQGKARLDSARRTLAVSAATAAWQGETLRLLEPAHVDFAEGVVVDRLRLGLRQAALQLAGRMSPSLDIEMRAKDLPLELADLFVPGLGLDGNVELQGKLKGQADRPVGTLRMNASGLHLRQGAGYGLAPATLVATAELHGTRATIDGRLQAGPSAILNVSGYFPLAPLGNLALRTEGSADLTILDPLLARFGQRLRGRPSLEASLVGTLAQPRLDGTLNLNDGEFHDDLRGAHVTGMMAQLQADSGKLQIVRLEGRAGPGTLSARGNLDLLAGGMPVDVSLSARNALGLNSDRLSVNLDGDIRLYGRATGSLTTAGNLQINRAEIRLPERLPTSIAVLKLHEPGVATPPPSASASSLSLDLALAAPRQIFLRGRGLDVELGGSVHLSGSAAAARPTGKFELLRGSYTLAGQPLSFSRGEVGFNSDDITDPTLNLSASASNGKITAILAVTGTAKKPSILLSSTPELPPDEVLAQLLFGHGTASLNPFELAQIAAAAAALTGVGTSTGNPLERLRTSLGLDRLSVGGGRGGSQTLEGGRYVAPGVYVGTKQGVSGSGATQATVQVDVVKGLKLEGAVGTGSPGVSTASPGAGSVGVIYQFEY